MKHFGDSESVSRFFAEKPRAGGVGGFSAWKESKILLYGAGNLGRKLYACLMENGVQPICFIDRNAAACSTPVSAFIPTAKELEPYHEDAVVILAGLFGRTQDAMIRQCLQEEGFCHIYALHEINWQTIESQSFLSHLFIGSYDPANLARDEQQIREAYELFSTEEERAFFLALLAAYRAGDVTQFPMPLPLEGQYLAKDVPEQMDYRRLIDCGAYDGDTLRSLLHHGESIEAYAAFEPQGDLCAGIQSFVQQRNDIPETYILPLGASDCYEQLRFIETADGRSAAKADPSGTAVLQCVPLDGVLRGFAPTMIKMDIEGMEPRALAGAAQLIRQYHPQLAICVYHDISHLWSIPLQIKELYEGYRLYTRNYQFMGLETVVYAVP